LIRDFINQDKTIPILSSFATRYDAVVANVPKLLKLAAKD
jgi:hypothetical protein